VPAATAAAFSTLPATGVQHVAWLLLAFPAAGAAVLLIGTIYTIHPGLDVDVGFRTRLNGTGAAQQWLMGITFRGAP